MAAGHADTAPGPAFTSAGRNSSGEYRTPVVSAYYEPSYFNM